ncbi:hypothetical protein LCGC14_1035160 [marine sediment metagenome]|uniref:Uncharacterized protein n=1 Tax=marine sediment metagenome TaxID=412755 RepID=A0A0F9NF15_9ZZZZ
MVDWQGDRMAGLGGRKVHYYPDNQSKESLEKIRRTSVCAECGRQLSIYLDLKDRRKYIACSGQLHEGITREYKEPVETYQTKLRRQHELEKEHGAGVGTALAKYQSVAVMTREIATEIVDTLWGEAPSIEKTKAIILCHTYNLNPLMKHIHLVKYNRWDRDHKKVIGEDWTMMLGIGATRLMAQRKHNYSYLDMTPRKATQEEIDKILGDTAKPDNIYGFVHIKDVATGAEAFGLRGISKSEKIKGEEKGNTHLNLACVRAERLALDRQYPGEMPQDVEVLDDTYVELPDIGKVDATTGEIKAEEENTVEAEVVSEEEVVAEKVDEIPQPAAEEKAEVTQDESPVTEKQVADLKALMEKAGKSMTDMGSMMSKELKWSVPKTLQDLKKWQMTKLMDILNKALG